MTYVVTKQDRSNSKATRATDLPRLTSLRWFAALAVFGFHSLIILHIRVAVQFVRGEAGVAFFFVLSGFLLTWVNQSNGSTFEFMRRRFARVYPSYFVAYLLACGMSVVVLGTKLPWLSYLSSTVLIQGWFRRFDVLYGANPPGWSISNEAFFYVLFPVLVRFIPKSSTKAWFALLLLFSVGAAATTLLAVKGLGETVAYTNPIVRLPEFCIGMVLAAGVKHGWRFRVSFLLLAGSIAIVAVLSRRLPNELYPVSDYLILIPTSLLVLSAATRDLDGRPGVMRGNTLTWLGKVSFSFYLVQVPIMNVLERFAFTAQNLRGPGPDSPAWLLAISLPICLLAATLLHHLVEVPAYKAILRRGQTDPNSVDRLIQC